MSLLALHACNACQAPGHDSNHCQCKVGSINAYGTCQVSGALAKQRASKASSALLSWRQRASWQVLKRRAQARMLRRNLAGPFASWARAAADANLQRQADGAWRGALLGRAWRGFRRHHAVVQAARAEAFFQLATRCR